MHDLPSEISRLIDEVSSDFEEQWQPKQPIDYAKWLSRVPLEYQDVLCKDLAEVDQELRQRHQTQPDVAADDDVAYHSLKIEASQADSDGQTLASNPSSADSFVENSTNVLRRVDNYELIRELKSGGMGDVYVARHHQFRDRYYAIKLIKAGRISDEALARFQHEINVAGKLKHPNIVFSYDAGRSGNEPYLVMEFIQGCDLDQLVKQNGPLSIPNACEVIRQAAVGLQYAYEKAGLTHRDIKPANLMLAYDHKIKILDLGLARLREQSYEGELTTEGQMLGTPDYMAPEQWVESSKVSTTADIYSLGCSLFALLTGHPPFYTKEKSSLSNKMRAHESLPPPHLRDVRPEVAQELSSILDRCLSKEAKDRYQTPNDLAEALKPFCLGADFLEYRVAETSVGPEAIQPTWVNDETEDDTHFSKSSSESATTSSRRWMAGAGVVILIICLSLWNWNWNGRAGDAARSAPLDPTQIVAIRTSNDHLKLGQINQDAPGGQVVFEGERSRLEVLFPEKRFSMVLGITPARNDDKVVCIWPADASPQVLSDGFILGKRSREQQTLNFKNSQDVSVLDTTWQFSDGVGMHAFVVISSKNPLPRFADVKDELLGIDWPSADAFPKHWMIENGEANPFLFSKQFQHRALDKSNDGLKLQPIVNQIQSIFENTFVDGIVFNVEPNPSTSFK